MNEQEEIWLSSPSLSHIPKLANQFCLKGGDVFLPAGAFGNEASALIMAMDDGESVLTDGDHFYARAQWLRTIYPKDRDIIDMIESDVKKYQEADNAPPSL